MVERRSRTPGASIYLVAAPNGVAVAGNVLELPAGVLDQNTAVEIDYERLGEPDVERHAIARVFTLPGGFRLLIGHDLEDRERLRRILGSALFTSLLWLLGIGDFRRPVRRPAAAATGGRDERQGRDPVAR